MTSDNRTGHANVLLSFFVFPSIVSATIQITVQAPLTAGMFSAATWTREQDDPMNFVLAKVDQLDAPVGIPIAVPNSNVASGSVSIKFEHSGYVSSMQSLLCPSDTHFIPGYSILLLMIPLRTIKGMSFYFPWMISF